MSRLQIVKLLFALIDLLIFCGLFQWIGTRIADSKSMGEEGRRIVRRIAMLVGVAVFLLVSHVVMGRLKQSFGDEAATAFIALLGVAVLILLAFVRLFMKHPVVCSTVFLVAAAAVLCLNDFSFTHISGTSDNDGESAKTDDSLPIEALKAPPSREQSKEEVLREFARSDAPSTLAVIQELDSIITIQEKELEKLREKLMKFEREPESNKDYLALRDQLQELRDRREYVILRLEDAYIAKSVSDATLGRKDTEELLEKTRDNGIREAEEAIRRYKELRDAK